MYRVEKTNVHLYRPVDFGYKMHFRIKILALHGQHNLQTLIQSQKNVGQIPNFLLKSSKRLRRSELHCAHSSINVGLLCHCSLYGYEFFDKICLFVILIYDIYNKISKLDLFGHFCFWPLLASYRGHWKTFLLLLIQQWLVGHFQGLIQDIQPTWNECKILTSFWAIPLSSKVNS